MQYEIDSQNGLTYRFTPWDERAFGFATLEILSITCSSPEMGDQLLGSFLSAEIAKPISFFYTRIDAQSLILRTLLQRHGFYYAETSFRVSLSLRKVAQHSHLLRDSLVLTTPNDRDFEEIRSIARDSFHYSRFHEDSNIDIERAKLRYHNWIDDLVRQDKQFLIYKQQDRVLAFLCYSIHNQEAKLILAGSVEGKGYLSYSFWPSFLRIFRDQGIESATTIISASNLGIMNLYVALGFKYESTMLGFHKFSNLISKTTSHNANQH